MGVGVHSVFRSRKLRLELHEATLLQHTQLRADLRVVEPVPHAPRFRGIFEHGLHAGAGQQLHDLGVGQCLAHLCVWCTVDGCLSRCLAGLCGLFRRSLFRFALFLLLLLAQLRTFDAFSVATRAYARWVKGVPL